MIAEGVPVCGPLGRGGRVPAGKVYYPGPSDNKLCVRSLPIQNNELSVFLLSLPPVVGRVADGQLRLLAAADPVAG